MFVQPENDRSDMIHCIIHDYALNRRLHNADLEPQNRRWEILDVGCGTGIWCYDFATQHPYANVTGIDLMVNQPDRIDSIPNCLFSTPIDFNEPNWPFQERTFDFIRASRLCGSVTSWSNMYRNFFRYVFRW